MAAGHLVTLAIQVDGQLRDQIEASANTSEDQIRELVPASERVRRFPAERTIWQVVMVPGRLINIMTETD